MAGAPSHEPARSRRRGGDLAAPSELPRKRPRRAVARDGDPALPSGWRFRCASATGCCWWPASRPAMARAARRCHRSRRRWTPCAWCSRAMSRTRPSQSTATGTWWRPTGRSGRCWPTSPTHRCCEPPVNVLRLSLHPGGIAPRIVNLAEWRAHLLERLRRQNETFADPALEELERELRSYPGGVTQTPADPQ